MGKEVAHTAISPFPLFTPSPFPFPFPAFGFPLLYSPRTMQTITKIRWRWGVIAALAITLLSLFPQCYLWWERGRQWNGNQAFF